VYRITKINGFTKGLKAFKYRFKNCRPGYQIIYLHEKPHIISVNNEIFCSEEIRDNII